MRRSSRRPAVRDQTVLCNSRCARWATSGAPSAYNRRRDANVELDMTAPSSRLPLALTMGDPAGIGPELALARLARARSLTRRSLRSPTPGPRRARAAARPRRADRRDVARRGERGVRAGAAGRRALAARADARPGRARCRLRRRDDRSRSSAPSVTSGRAKRARSSPIRSPRRRSIAAGFRFPGHTEYLGALAALWGAPAQPVMMIWSPALAVVPVTIHIALERGCREL